jgi:hypothetical protein
MDRKITKKLAEEEKEQVAKRKEYAKEAFDRLKILIKLVKTGDFDAKIYKRYDLSDEDQAEYEETGEYPEDSDAFEDVLGWFDENIRDLIEESNINPKKTVDKQQRSSDLTIQQYVKQLEKIFQKREIDIYDEILENRKAEKAKAELDAKQKKIKDYESKREFDAYRRANVYDIQRRTRIRP